VYWDHLTFDAAGTPKMPNVMYSGVYFKWGSLIGFSPSEQWNTSYLQFESDTKLYKPNYNVTYPEQSDWTVYTQTTIGKLDYKSLTAMPGTTTGSRNGTHLYDQSTPANYAETYPLGDICRYIGETGAGPKGYLIPTANEFLRQGDWGVSGDFTDRSSGGSWAAGVPNGRGTVPGTPRQYLMANTNVVLPAVGWRDSTGWLQYVGSNGVYWSGSPDSGMNETNGGRAYNTLATSGGGGNAPSSSSVWNGFSVRCIRVP
jgi:hypothetical protein